MGRFAHISDRGSLRLRVVGWGVALAADVAAVEGSVPTMSTTGSWWGPVITVSIDALAVGR